MAIIKITDLDLSNKRILIRSDLNIPIKSGKIVSDARIKASLPTINMAIKKGGKVMVVSHLGNPIEGKYDLQFSLLPVVHYLQNILPYPVHLVKNYLNGININTNELIILENVRFNKGEIDNNEMLAKKYAALCDIFVMDAFGSGHRVQASTYGVGIFAPIACAGLLFTHELEQLDKILNRPKRPMVAIIGGSKVSTKLKVLSALQKVVDLLIIGGGIANTFIMAQGYNIGKSLYEPSLISESKHLLQYNNIVVPVDVRVSNIFAEAAIAVNKRNNKVQFDEYIMDIGDISIQLILNILQKAKTILWNGPLGVFEFVNFRKGSETIGRFIAESNCFSIIGGGDTVALTDILGITHCMSYISTGGGSFLKYIEYKTLPAILMLEQHIHNL